MSNKLCNVALVYLFGAFLLATILANDMELEVEKGIFLVLHENHSWSYKSTNTPELTSNVTLKLDNDSVVQINTNNTWFFIEGKQSSIETYSEEKVLNTVYSIGKAQGSDLIETKRAAVRKASEYLAKQLKTSFKDKNLTIETLVHCIGNVGKDIKKQEKFVQNIWKIEIKIILNEDQISHVINCAIP